MLEIVKSCGNQMLWKHSLKVSVISSCFSLFRKWRQPQKWTPAIYMLKLVCLQKFPNVYERGWQFKTMPPIVRFGSIFWWPAALVNSRGSCVLPGIDPARCSCFAVKRHWLSSPFVVFRTSPCMHNDPSAQHMCLLGKLVGKICS